MSTKNNMLMFTKKTVNETYDHLTRLLRLVMYHNGVTLDNYAQMYSDHASRVSKKPETIQSGCTNEKRTLFGNSITSQKFFFNIQDILRFRIVRISLTVKDPYSEVEYVYHSDEVLKSDTTDENDTDEGDLL